jgi:glycosyltransferase involved in cell wall biosynthesis
MYSNYEYIIVDGNSKDGTIEILEEYKNIFSGRMRYISEPDEGVYDAMNKGIKMSTGDVIGFLNSDDIYYDVNVLSDIAQAMEEKDVDCVYGDLLFVYPKNKKRIIREWKGSPYQEGIFDLGWVPAHPTFYVRSNCYSKYGLYDTSMKVSADFDLMMRFLVKEKIRSRYLDRRFVIMCYGGKSTGSIKNILLGNKAIKRSFNNNGYKMPYFYYCRRLFPKIIDVLKHSIRKTTTNNNV